MMCVWQCGHTMLSGHSPKAMFIIIGPGGVMMVVVVLGGGT